MFAPFPKSPSLVLKIRANFCDDSWDTTTLPLSSSLVAWFLIHINMVFYCHLIINGILFAYLTLLLTSLLCVCAHVSPGMISPQHPPNKSGEGERKHSFIWREFVSNLLQLQGTIRPIKENRLWLLPRWGDHMLHLDWSPQGNGGSQGHLVVISSPVSMRQAYSSKKKIKCTFSLSCVLSCSIKRSCSIQSE